MSDFDQGFMEEVAGEMIRLRMEPYLHNERKFKRLYSKARLSLVSRKLQDIRAEVERLEEHLKVSGSVIDDIIYRAQMPSIPHSRLEES